ATRTGGTDSNGNPPTTIRPAPQNSQQGSVASNDYTTSVLTPIIDLTHDDAIGKPIHIQIQKDGNPAWGNGIQCSVVDVQDELGEPSNALITPAVGASATTQRTTIDQGNNQSVTKDGVATFQVTPNPNFTGGDTDVRITV